MPERLSGFDWDAANRAHCQKHGVSIADQALFRNEPRVAGPTARSIEDRLIAVGRTRRGRPRLFAFRVRDGLRLIRPVSARYMHAQEIAQYEAPSTQDDDRSRG